MMIANIVVAMGVIFCIVTVLVVLIPPKRTLMEDRYSQSVSEANERSTLIVVLVGGLSVGVGIISFGVYGLRDSGSSYSSVYDATESKEFKEAGWISKAAAEVRRKLKDPQSAEFSRSRVSYKIGSPAVCGSVNAKNSFGGYIGYKRFVFFGSGHAYLEEDVSDFDDLWAKSC